MPRWNQKWSVESDSGNTYTVSLDEDGKTWGCSCPAWIYKRRTCRHILQVQLEQSHALLAQAKEQLLGKPAPAPFSKRDSKYSKDGRAKRQVEFD